MPRALLQVLFQNLFHSAKVRCRFRVVDDGGFHTFIICSGVACKNPGKPASGSIFPVRAMYSVDDVINFKCNDGYQLVGSESAVCGEEGEFSETNPTCQCKSAIEFSLCPKADNPSNRVLSMSCIVTLPRLT